jgi:hypothetical protein
MSPLFGCFPVLTLFASLGLLAVIMYGTGAGKGTDGHPLPAAEAHGPPPYWVGLAVLAAALFVLFLLSFVTDG